MKLVSKIFFIACGIFLFTSCNKDVSLAPLGFTPTTITTEAQLDNQIVGAYQILATDQMYGYGMWGYINAGTDESFRSGTNASSSAFEYYNNIDANNGNNLTLWRELYRGIERCNVILDVADQPDMDSVKRANIKGQALFLRSFYFFTLAVNFGDIPLKTTVATDLGTEFNVARTPVKQVYEKIITDLTMAEGMVYAISRTQTPTIITQSAVRALLARVCLYMAGNPINDASKYADALTWAKKVINSNLHSLNASGLSQYAGTPAYSRLFINNMQNNANDRNATEGIFDAAFIVKSITTGTYAGTTFPLTQRLGAGAQVGGSGMGVYCPDGTATAPIGFCSGIYRAQPRLFNLFAPGDQRRDWAIAPYMYKNNSTIRFFALTVNITGGGGSGASATAYTSATGAITNIVIDNGGTGYTTPPTITFSAYGLNTSTTQTFTTAATAVVDATKIVGGKITEIRVVTPGLGYPTLYERCIGKWRREYELNLPPVRLADYTSSNFPIIRYADVLLMAAEAELKSGGITALGLEYYNQVRRRAFGYPPLTPVPGFDATTVSMQDIIDERSRELCFEGLRRYDLLRWGIMPQVMQSVVTYNAVNAPSAFQFSSNYAANSFLVNPVKYSLLPVPGVDIGLNNLLTQNPGW